MHDQLTKAIALSKKTGDRLIVYDASQKDNIYVVMSLDEYEKMVIGKSEVRGLTEDELLDKINRDIAIWKSDQFVNSKAEFNGQIDQNYLPNNEENSGWDRDFEDVKSIFNERDLDYTNFPKDKSEETKQKSGKNHWVIPAERKSQAEEVIEEDRQYLEEVKY
jgi:hypothetical protein